MTYRQALELIFLPGFSTAEEVTNLSGRGVGMDVVCTNIKQLSGTVEIESEIDKGTLITITLPMTLAVSQGLAFEAGGETFFIPVDQVAEVVKTPWENLRPALGKEIFHLRGEVLPVCRLNRLFGLPENPREEANLLIVQGSRHRLVIVIDHPMREQEIVVKPLHPAMQGLPGLSGATITGDGRALLVLDADKLAISARQ